MEALLDKFSTVIDRDRSAMREVPSDLHIYQHYEEYPSGLQVDRMLTPDHEGKHMLEYDLNQEHDLEHSADHEFDWSHGAQYSPEALYGHHADPYYPSYEHEPHFAHDE